MTASVTLKQYAIKEADVLRSVKQFFNLRGWRVYRMTAGGMTNPAGRYIPVGEDGVPDILCLYYLPSGRAFVLWCEVKSPHDRRKCRCRPLSDKLCNTCRQDQWQKLEEQRGGMVIRVSDLRELERWYGENYGHLHGPDGPRRGQMNLV